MNVSLNDGLFYVHYDSVNLYRSVSNPGDIRTKTGFAGTPDSEFELDLPASQQKYDQWLCTFQEGMLKRFESYRPVNDHPKASEHTVLENKMFHVIIEDNGWGFAVKLIARKDCKAAGLQKKLFETFYSGMRQVLLNITDTIYTRSGSWSVQPITETNQTDLNNYVKASRVKFDPKAKPTGKRPVQKTPVNHSQLPHD